MWLKTQWKLTNFSQHNVYLYFCFDSDCSILANISQDFSKNDYGLSLYFSHSFLNDFAVLCN